MVLEEVFDEAFVFAFKFAFEPKVVVVDDCLAQLAVALVEVPFISFYWPQ